MRNYDCRRCGETIELAREFAGRMPWYCEPCKKAKEVERIQARNVIDKAKRRELRNPNCIRCEVPLTFNDSGNRMDMRFICDACQYKRKLANHEQYNRRRGYKPIDEVRAEQAAQRSAKEAERAALRARRQADMEEKQRQCPWLNPKLTDAQAYRLQYKLDAAFRAREVARSVKRHNQTPLLRIWENIIARCENPNIKGYHRYGGRGIKVVESFRSSFQAFVDHMGQRPSPKHSVDRINVDGHYEPGNVRWADFITQARNVSKLKTTPAMLAAAMRARMDKRRQQQERKARADRELARVVVGQSNP